MPILPVVGLKEKNTSGTCHFLGYSLVSWHSKKKNLVALSMVKVEHIGVSFLCTNSLDEINS